YRVTRVTGPRPSFLTVDTSKSQKILFGAFTCPKPY
ncbi:MAG: hypothetical protein ACJAQW_001938, partial [Paracoccaceae bacterium]